MIYPLVRDLASDGIPVKVTCRVLGFSTQAFYKWRANPVSDRDWSDAHLVDAAREIHIDDPTFGYRFIADELRAERGIRASENRVHRLCSSHGIFSVLARKVAAADDPDRPFTTISSGESSGRPGRTSCGSPTSPSTAQMRASSTCVRSRTRARTASSATRSMTG